jgi:hypothetical protein
MANELGNWRLIMAEKSRSTAFENKNAALPKGKAAPCLIMTRKEELLCPWQAWQRPTLPGLKP